MKLLFWMIVYQFIEFYRLLLLLAFNKVAVHVAQAAITFDKYHILKVINEAVDAVRKAETKEQALLQGQKYVGYGFHMHPPDYLSQEQISFLMYFYPKLFSLPGGINVPNGELRRGVADMLEDFPEILIDPMIVFRNLIKENARYLREWLYTGDLETDFLRVLG